MTTNTDKILLEQTDALHEIADSTKRAADAMEEVVAQLKALKRAVEDADFDSRRRANERRRLPGGGF